MLKIFKGISFLLLIWNARADGHRCLIAIRNLKNKIEARNMDPAALAARRLKLQGVFSINDIREGAVYWSAVAGQPIKITKIDKSSVPPVIHYSYGPQRSPIIGQANIEPSQNIFVPAARESSVDIFGKAAVASLITKPENIPRIFAITAINKLLASGSAHLWAPAIAKARNEGLLPSNMKGENAAAKQSMIAGDTVAVDAYLDHFYQDTGIDPYKLGAYQSAGTKSSGGSDHYTLQDSFLFFKGSWKQLIGMEQGTVTYPIDRAMADLSWNFGNDKFKDTSHRVSLFDYRANRDQAIRLKSGSVAEARAQIKTPEAEAKIRGLVDAAQKAHPGKEVVFVGIPNTKEGGASPAIQTVLKELGYNVSPSENLTFSDKVEGEQKNQDNRIERIMRFRQTGSPFSLKDTSNFNDKIVIAVDDVETSGVTMDNAMIDLYFRGGAAAVYSLAIYKVE